MIFSVNYLTVFLGVLSGVITASLLGLIGIFLRKGLLPRFQELVYQGVDVSGNWHHKYEAQLSPTETTRFELFMSLHQKAYQIVGELNVRNIHPGGEYVNYYRLTGMVKDNYVLFTYTAKGTDRTGIGSFLLRVAQGGTKLIGSAVFTPDADADDTHIGTRKNMIFKKS